MRQFLSSLCVAAVVLLAREAPAAPPSPRPDLVITTAVPVGPNAVVVRVRNIGTAAAVPCRLALWVYTNPGGQFLGGPYFVVVPALAPGQHGSVTITTPAGVTVMPGRRLRFYIDYSNLNAELIESNNSYMLFVP